MIDIANARALVETLKDYAEHPSSFTDISPTEADAAADLIDALLNEVERLEQPRRSVGWRACSRARRAGAGSERLRCRPAGGPYEQNGPARRWRQTGDVSSEQLRRMARDAARYRWLRQPNLAAP